MTFNRLLGFDLRLTDELYLSPEWPKERRDSYLLNPSVRWPLSVDKMVWPTVFEYDETGRTSDLKPVVQIEPVSFHQEALELWSDCSEMIRVASKCGIPKEATVPIALDIASETSLLDFSYWHAVLDDSYPLISFDETWVLLGYDVADCYRLSGLANCSYRTEDKLLLSQEWSSALNQFGLIQTFDAAAQFVRITNRRVSDHAPFFVYGIYSNGEPSNRVGL
jgi:hypothetical protein